MEGYKGRGRVREVRKRGEGGNGGVRGGVGFDGWAHCASLKLVYMRHLDRATGPIQMCGGVAPAHCGHPRAGTRRACTRMDGGEVSSRTQCRDTLGCTGSQQGQSPRGSPGQSRLMELLARQTCVECVPTTAMALRAISPCTRPPPPGPGRHSRAAACGSGPRGCGICPHTPHWPQSGRWLRT